MSTLHYQEVEERTWTPEDAKADALARHPKCSYAVAENGMTMWFRLTWVVRLWRNKECWAAGDRPRVVCEGYLQARDAT